MKIIIWGLGYVGTVSAACFSELGHEVIGVDINPKKVSAINSKNTLIKEPGLQSLIHKMVDSGCLKAVTSGEEFVKDFDLSLICVGTPNTPDGDHDLGYLKAVAENIGNGLKNSDRFHVVALRSTVFPGVSRNILKPTLESSSQKEAGVDFGVVMNPEFLREASAIKDFYAPPYTVIGEFDQQSGEILNDIYKNIVAPVYRVSLEEAEILKVTNNVFHGLKTGFANEIGRICDRAGIDSRVVMDLVCADTKLNISTAYLKPGYAFGGSCLPKDIRSLSHHAKKLGVDLPIITSIMPSNQLQIEEARIKINSRNSKHVCVLGLSFKPGTDDLRESPILKLIQSLWQDGLVISVYDPDVNLDQMLGSNQEYLERHLPQIRSIIKQSISEAMAKADLIVLFQNRGEFLDAINRLDTQVCLLDLVNIQEKLKNDHIVYEGLSW
jgi:GDP-mannose 6-dehydrogenase